MKKPLSIILAVVMLLSCMCITAFAAEADTIIWDEEELRDNIFSYKEPSGKITEASNTINGITAHCKPAMELTGWEGTSIDMGDGGTITFTSSVGKISRIDISAGTFSGHEIEIGCCPGWSISDGKLTWTGDPTETVTLTITDTLCVKNISKIVFTMAEENAFLTSFTLKVDYNNTYDPTTKATHINETLWFGIKPITENAPKFKGDTIILNVKDGKGSTVYPLPTVDAVGDYWYAITGNAGHTAGAIHDTNTYYLHLIADYKDGGYGIVSALLHTNAPDEYGTFKDDDKIDTISNFYAEGSLTVTQYAYVNGERSSADEFTNEVTFKLPEGTDIAGNITYGDKTITPDEWQDGTVSVAIDLRDGDSVIFEGLPDGTTYTVKQKTDAPAMGYDDPIYRRDIDDPDETGDDVCEDRVEGTVSDLSDFVEIVNAKRIAIDVGVFLDNGAFVVLAVGALAVGAWLVISRRKENDYSDAE